MSDLTALEQNVSSIHPTIEALLKRFTDLDPDFTADTARCERLKLVAERASVLLGAQPEHVPVAAIKAAYLSLVTFVLVIEGPEAMRCWSDRSDRRAMLFTRSQGRNNVVAHAFDATADTAWFGHVPALRPSDITADNGARAYREISDLRWTRRFGTIWVMAPNIATLETLLPNFFPGISRSLLDARAVFPVSPEDGGVIVIRDGIFLPNRNP